MAKGLHYDILWLSMMCIVLNICAYTYSHPGVEYGFWIKLKPHQNGKMGRWIRGKHDGF